MILCGMVSLRQLSFSELIDDKPPTVRFVEELQFVSVLRIVAVGFSAGRVQCETKESVFIDVSTQNVDA